MMAEEGVTVDDILGALDEEHASAITKNAMSKARLFLDSSALFAGVASPSGAARVLLLLGETGQSEPARFGAGDHRDRAGGGTQDPAHSA